MPHDEGSRAPRFSQSLERGLHDPVVVQRDPAGARHRRPGPRGRAEQEHHLPVRGDPGQARLPAAGPGHEASTRSARGSSTSASRRSTRWRSPGWPGGRCRRFPTRPATPSSMAVLDGPDIVYVDRRRSGRASNFAMGLQPARRLATAGVLHVDGEGAAGVPGADRAAGAARPHRLRPPRAEDHHRPGAAHDRPRPGAAQRDRRQRRGARRWPALDRRAGPGPVRHRGRRGQRRDPPDRLERLGRVGRQPARGPAAPHRRRRSPTTGCR